MNPVAVAQKMTAEELAEWVIRPENDAKRWDLVRGEVSRPGEQHGVVCGNIAFVLNLYARQNNFGRVGTKDPGLLLEREPDTVRGPDVVFFGEKKQFRDLSPKWIEEPPLLVVEVLSPNDRPNKVTRQIGEYLRSGIRLVWIVDPETCEVAIHRADQPPVTLDLKLELAAEDVLPGFRCNVGDFFFEPDEERIPPA